VIDVVLYDRFLLREQRRTYWYEMRRRGSRGV